MSYAARRNNTVMTDGNGVWRTVRRTFASYVCGSRVALSPGCSRQLALGDERTASRRASAHKSPRQTAPPFDDLSHTLSLFLERRAIDERARLSTKKVTARAPPPNSSSRERRRACSLCQRPSASSAFSLVQLRGRFWVGMRYFCSVMRRCKNATLNFN